MTPDIKKALSLLKQGGLIGLPTETVYGLAADASNPAAVRKVFAAKGRPIDHPLIVHIGTLAELEAWAKDIPDAAYRLAQAFWPGPLTLILKKQDSVLSEVTGGQDTVALRMPNHPLALELLNAFGGGLVAPSANAFGRISPTEESAVLAELGQKVDFILPGGRTSIGIESTILDLHARPFTLLRQGMILQGELENCLGEPLAFPTVHTQTRAPGLLPTHYAPRTPLQLFDIKDLPRFLDRADSLVVLAQSPQPEFARHLSWQPMPPTPEKYAFELYAALRAADSKGAELILLETPLHAPEWAAIHDRLQRATSSRGIFSL